MLAAPSHTPPLPPECARLLALAERRPRAAVALAERALVLAPAEPAGLAWRRFVYGWALLAWERIDAARAPLATALAAFEQLGARYGALRCRYALLLADQLQLARPGLDAEFAARAAEFAALGAPLDALRATIDHARHLNVLGRARDAEELLDSAAPELAAATPIDRARHDRIRGAAANARGDFTRAAELLARAEQVFRARAYPVDAAKCWLDMAWLALRQEQLDAAQAGYTRAERAFAMHDLPLQRAACAKNLGLLYAKRGDYDTALGYSLAALADFTALRRAADIGACHLHLGNIYFYIGGWDAALACYSRAESTYAALAMDGYSLVAQRNRAMVYRIQGRRAETTALLATVESRARALDLPLELAEAHAIRGALLAETADWAAAAECFRQARALFTRHHNPHGVAECQLELGWIALAQAQGDAAQAAFVAAAPATRQHPHDHWRVEYGLARCAELRGEPSAALAHYRAAGTTVAALRARLAGEAISSHLFAQAAQMHADAVAIAARQADSFALLELSERQRALMLQRALHLRAATMPTPAQALLEQQRARLAQALLEPAGAGLIDATLAAYNAARLAARPEHDPARPALLPADPPDLARLRAHLAASYGRDWSVLIYVASAETLAIGELTADTLAFSHAAFDAELRTLIEQASQPSYRSYTYLNFPLLQGAAQYPWQRLVALTERLLPAALRARLHPGHRLLIVPAGPLHALPWPALRLADGWLAERAVVQVVPSLLATPCPAAPPPGSAALFVGCQSFGDRAPPLPGVEREHAVVARLWPGVAALRDSGARAGDLAERSRRGELREYRVVHIASHARLVPSHGVAAHIKLADGDMALADLAALDLDQCLVLLSACDGAAAEVLPGEEVFSLSWAFLAAGARAVLASLWPVGDQAVVALVERFYTALRQHDDAALALAQAQRTLCSESPLAWGSFVVTGLCG